MKQLQFYKYATWVLLVLNLSLVTWFFLTAPPHPHDNEVGRKTAIDILNLDEQQNESFLKFVHQHKQKMKELNNQQRSFLQPYFKNLFNADITTNSDSLLQTIQTLEQKKIESTYQHFQEIKSILKPEQQTNFESFIEHALEMILMKKKKKPFPPKDK